MSEPFEFELDQKMQEGSLSVLGRTVVDYTLVYEQVVNRGDHVEVTKSLTSQVKDKISEGWEPQGGVASDGDHGLVQAMVKVNVVVQMDPGEVP